MTRNGKTSPAGELRRAAGYIRISALMGREQDVDLLSDKIQREKIEAWAAYRGFTVTRWYCDLDVSGREGVRRPEFERMMADAADHRFEAVAVYRLTRFARSVKQAATSYTELRKHGISLVSVTEDIDTSTASGSFMQNILFAMAEFESERISEEWRNVHQRRRRLGIAHVARPMLGYQIAGAEITAVDEAEAAAIRLIYNRRHDGAGYATIRNELRAAGFRTKTGGVQFPDSTLSSILRNPVYAGLVRTSDDELVDGTHPAIVSRELWESVQRRHVDATARNRFRTQLCSGLVICHACGGRMRVDTNQHGSHVYRCGAKARTIPCSSGVRVEAEILNEIVEQAFLRRYRSSRMPNQGKVRRTRQQAEWQRKATRLRQRVDELTRALDAIADQRFVKGTLEAAEYERQFARYSAERADAIEKAEEFERMVDTVRPLETDVLRLWDRMPLDVKQRALRVSIDRVVVGPSSHRGRFRDRSHKISAMRDRVKIAWIA